MTGISMRRLIGAACVASALMSGSALAQTAAPLTAAPVARPALSAKDAILGAARVIAVEVGRHEILDHVQLNKHCICSFVI